MLRLTLRNLFSHLGRLAMTAFAVVLGVAFVVGAFVVTDTMRSSVGGLFTDVTHGVDLTVRAVSDLDGGQMNQQRGRIPAELLDRVRAVDGVAAAEGNLGSYAQILDKDGKPVKSTGAPFLGVAWGKDDALFPVTLDSGRKPVGPDEVAIDRGTAEDYGLGVGSTTQVLLIGGPRPVTVVGIFTFGESNSLLGARLTAFDASVAQTLFDAPGEWDDVAIALAPGADDQAVMERIRAFLPESAEVVTTRAVVDENVKSTDQLVSVFQNVLLGFAGIALFVSAFFINNTFAIVVGQRVREFGLLRGLGASPGQIRGSIAGEALIVGVVSSAIGIVAGLGVAKLLTALLGAAGLDLPATGLRLEPRTWIAALVVGVGVTLVASQAPARRAARVSPVQAMTQGLLGSDAGRARRVLYGSVLAGSGVVLVALGLFVIHTTALLFGALAVGALTVFIGVAWLSPLIAVPVVSAIGRPFARLGTAGRLARSNAVRSPERTARTAAALMIGLALVTMVLVVGESMKRSFSAKIDQSVGADYIVSSSGNTGMSPTIAESLRSLPEVGSASGVRLGQMKVDGKQVQALAADGKAVAQLVDIGVEQGSLDDLDRGAVFLHHDSARDLGVGVGDHIDAQFAAGGPQSLRVAGIYGDATFAGNYLIDLSTLAEYAPTNELDMFVFARSAPEVTPAAARAAIEGVLSTHPETTLEDRAEYRQSQERQFDQLLLAVNGLLGLALIIALLGIANTMGLAVLERTQEIGLLRAVGMSRRQTRSMILVESLTVSLFGTMMGIVLGLGFGAAVTLALPESIVTQLAVPVPSLGALVLIAALCGALAGMLPARRAARLDVLQAIQHQ